MQRPQRDLRFRHRQAAGNMWIVLAVLFAVGGSLPAFGQSPRPTSANPPGTAKPKATLPTLLGIKAAKEAQSALQPPDAKPTHAPAAKPTVKLAPIPAAKPTPAAKPAPVAKSAPAVKPTPAPVAVKPMPKPAVKTARQPVVPPKAISAKPANKPTIGDTAAKPTKAVAVPKKTIPLKTDGQTAKPTRPLTGIAAGKAALKSGPVLVRRRTKRPVYIKPTIIYAIDTVSKNNEVSAISADGRFVTVHLTPETRIRRGSETVQPADLTEGMELACWGAWDPNDSEIYLAKGVMVRRKLDDFQLRMKINEACQKTIRPHAGAASPAPTPAAPTPQPVTPAPTKPAEPGPNEPKPGEPKPGEPGQTKPAEPNPTSPGIA